MPSQHEEDTILSLVFQNQEGKGYKMNGYRELCRTGCNTFYLRENLCMIL